jgi:hypothetical protein
MWTRPNWRNVRKGSIGSLLWTWQSILGFHRKRGNSKSCKQELGSQEELFYTEIISHEGDNFFDAGVCLQFEQYSESEISFLNLDEE